MTENSGISVADALALRNSDGNNGFGGDGAWWIILLALLFGWGGNGNFGGGGNACCTPATAQGMSDAFNFGQLDNGIRSLANGLCDGFYAQNNAINGVLSAIQNCCCQTQLGFCEGFGGVNQNIANLGYQMGQGFCGVDKTIMQSSFQNQSSFNALATQIAQCCCDLRNDIATQSCDTRSLIQRSTRDIIDYLTQDKLDALRAENQTLKFQASQTAQNAFITANQQAQTAELIRRLGVDTPVPAYIVPNPNYCYSNYANNSGCGCGGCY